MKLEKITALFCAAALSFAVFTAPAAAAGQTKTETQATTSQTTKSASGTTAKAAETTKSATTAKAAETTKAASSAKSAETTKAAAATTKAAETTTATSAAVTYDQDAGFSAIGGFRVEGTAALLVDLDTNTILYSQNPDQKVYPASLTKLMTCLVALEHGSLTDSITVTDSALKGMDADGTSADLKAGEVVSMKDLLYCILLASANEACNVVAEHVAGSVSAFVDLMNAKAQELGCTGTHFSNVHGLHDADHYTTARDLLKITEAFLANTTLRDISYETKYEMAATNLSAARTIYTTNYMTSTDKSYKYYYDKVKGVKTGYTDEAGRCLITTAQSGKLNLLSIVMGCATTDAGNGEYVLESFPQTKALLQYGFQYFDYVTVLSPLVPISEVPVNGGDHDSVVIAPLAEQSLVLPKDYSAEDVTTTVTLTDGTYVQAPVSAGTSVGTVSVFYRGKEIASGDITPITSVSAGKSVYQETQAAAESTPAKKASWPVVLLVAAALLLGIYAFSYLYRNAARRKNKRNRRRGR